MTLRPGYLTTEFWLTVLIDMLGVLQYAHVWALVPKADMAFVMAVVTGLYSLARGWAKNGAGFVRSAS